MSEKSFTYPEAFLNWQRRQFFDTNSADYLWVPEAEWCRADWQLPTYGEHIAGLTPFAFSGAGDGWCFFRDGEVLFCLHDEDEALVYAPHFLGWFYRRCLEFVAAVSDEDKDEAEEARELLVRGACLLKEAGALAYADMLAGLSPGSITEVQLGPGTVSQEQVLQIVRREFGERYVEGKIKWQWQATKGVDDGLTTTRARAHARGSDEDDSSEQAAEAAARERFQKEMGQKRYAEATTKADEAFRAKDFEQYVALLSPFSEMLTSVQQKKIKLANKKAKPKERD